MAETMPLDEAEERCEELVRRAAIDHEEFVITDEGRPAAVIVNAAHFEERGRRLAEMRTPAAAE